MKKLMEGLTIVGALAGFSAIESSILCGVAGLILLAAFALEIEIWEGGT